MSNCCGLPTVINYPTPTTSGTGTFNLFVVPNNVTRLRVEAWVEMVVVVLMLIVVVREDI